VGNVPYFLGDVGWLNEKVIRLIGTGRACPFKINHRIDQDVGDVNSLWAEFSGHRFRQHSLRCLCRGERRKVAFASEC
jgi:hypothetical protein